MAFRPERFDSNLIKVNNTFEKGKASTENTDQQRKQSKGAEGKASVAGLTCAGQRV